MRYLLSCQSSNKKPTIGAKPVTAIAPPLPIMSATKTYQNITITQAQDFLAEARDAGFTTLPGLVNLSSRDSFRILKKFFLSTLGFEIYYNEPNQTCVISITDLPFFLSADTVMAKIDGYVQAAQSDMPNPPAS